MHGSSVVLLHVATGVQAQWSGSDAGGEEIREDQAYLNRVRGEFADENIPVIAKLAFGDPVKEIVKWMQENTCDLVAMATHGHNLVGDIIHGTTAIRVQHNVSVPVLLLRAK
jgi:nucleotide-binding universal stress UspA family protein